MLVHVLVFLLSLSLFARPGLRYPLPPSITTKSWLNVWWCAGSTLPALNLTTADLGLSSAESAVLDLD